MTDLKMLNLIIGLLEYERIKYEPVTDVQYLLEHSGGNMGPNGICGVEVFSSIDQPTLITTIYDAVHFIDNNGLRRL